MSENILMDRLIAMEDVRCLAEKSENFYIFQENLDLPVYTFFTQFTLQEAIGKLYCHRPKFSTFFQALSRLHQ